MNVVKCPACGDVIEATDAKSVVCPRCNTSIPQRGDRRTFPDPRLAVIRNSNLIDTAVYVVALLFFLLSLLAANFDLDADSFSGFLMVCCILVMGGARIRIEIRNLRKDAILRNESKQ